MANFLNQQAPLSSTKTSTPASILQAPQMAKQNYADFVDKLPFNENSQAALTPMGISNDQGIVEKPVDNSQSMLKQPLISQTQPVDNLQPVNFQTIKSTKRPDINNNPGNINFIANDWQDEYGAVKGKDGRFALFPTPEKGIDAMDRLLGSKYYNDLTVDQALFKWTGSGLEGKGYNSKGMDLPKVGTVKGLSREQKNTLMVEMAKREGFSQLDAMKYYLSHK